MNYDEDNVFTFYTVISLQLKRPRKNRNLTPRKLEVRLRDPTVQYLLVTIILTTCQFLMLSRDYILSSSSKIQITH